MLPIPAHGSNPTLSVRLSSCVSLRLETSISSCIYGIVFKLDSAGNETVLHVFYGTTFYGGDYSGYNCSFHGREVVFKMKL